MNSIHIKYLARVDKETKCKLTGYSNETMDPLDLIDSFVTFPIDDFQTFVDTQEVIRRNLTEATYNGIKKNQGTFRIGFNL